MKYIIFFLLILTACSNPTAKVVAQVERDYTDGLCGMRVSLSVVEIGGLEKACFSDGSFRFSILNNNNNDIMAADVIVDKQMVRAKGSPGKVFSGEIDVRQVSSAEIIPFIEVDGKLVRCQDKSVLVEDIRIC